MLAKIYQKTIMIIILGSFVIGCAPNYTASFQKSSPHNMSRYSIEDKNSTESIAVADADEEIVAAEIKIKEVVIEPGKIDNLVDDPEKEIRKPASKAELIQMLKENPEATVAINMDKKERKALKKQMKKQLKEHTKSVESAMDYQQTDGKVLYYILAVLLPPLAVGLWRGIGDDFWINILLTLLLYIPGIIHAIIVISNKPKATRAY